MKDNRRYSILLWHAPCILVRRYIVEVVECIFDQHKACDGETAEKFIFCLSQQALYQLSDPKWTEGMIRLDGTRKKFDSVYTQQSTLPTTLATKSTSYPFSAVYKQMLICVYVPKGGAIFARATNQF